MFTIFTFLASRALARLQYKHLGFTDQFLVPFAHNVLDFVHVHFATIRPVHHPFISMRQYANYEAAFVRNPLGYFLNFRQHIDVRQVLRHYNPKFHSREKFFETLFVHLGAASVFQQDFVFVLVE